MTDPQAPANEQDTPVSPDESAPQGTPEDTGSRTDEVNVYEKRYNDLRPEFDRTKQTLTQYEQFIESLRNPETQAEALAALGYEIDGGEEDPEDDDPTSQLASQVAQMQEFLQQQAEREAQAEAEQLFEQYVEQEFSELDPNGEWDDDYAELVVASAPLDEDGIPDLKASHERLQKRLEADFQKRLKAKRAPQAPNGASPSSTPDLDDPQVRREWMAQQMSAAASLT